MVHPSSKGKSRGATIQAKQMILADAVWFRMVPYHIARALIFSTLNVPHWLK